MILLTRNNHGRRMFRPARAIGLCTGMIMVPALLFSTAAGFASGGADVDVDTEPPSPPLVAVTAGTGEVAENAALVRPRAVAAVPASSPAVPVPVLVAPPPPPPKRPPVRETGVATWYEITDGTCAHVTLPMGTIVTVTAIGTGATTTCRVADRGPFMEGRVIDLDTATFAELAPPEAGVLLVQLGW